MKTIKGTEITFERVTTLEQLAKLQEFAKSFGHKVNDIDAKEPLLIVKKGEEWIGYTQVFLSPVLFTAWNPEVAKPRDVVEGMKAFAGWAKLESALGNKLPALTTVPLDTNSFYPEIMEKLGLKRLGMEIYTVET